jgi:hypothetical protein
MTNVVDCAIADLEADMELELVCRPVDDTPPLPFFRPRPPGASRAASHY